MKEKFSSFFVEGGQGLFFSIIIGLSAYFFQIYSKSSLADPLVVALILGIILNLILKGEKWGEGFSKTPMIILPIGIIFYAMKNLNFVTSSQINPYLILLLMIIMLVYFGFILLMGKWFGQKKEITYLIATGSAICGASAIALTAPSVKADSDDVSISLLSVLVAAIFGLFVIMPLVALLMNYSNQTYAMMSGSIMQFTGFVKASINSMPALIESMISADLSSFAVSIKAFRYLGLLIAIPLFTSLIRKKFIIPWYLWAFLGSGIIGSVIFSMNPGFYKETLSPVIKPIYNILWSVAMAAIGLTVKVDKLLSNNGIKALFMALGGFIAAIITFVLGISLLPI